jgi:hypothetical protein
VSSQVPLADRGRVRCAVDPPAVPLGDAGAERALLGAAVRPFGRSGTAMPRSGSTRALPERSRTAAAPSTACRPSCPPVHPALGGPLRRRSLSPTASARRQRGDSCSRERS